MAQVHVHVTSEKPRAGLVHRTVHWADRAALGLVMGVVAFALERAVLRSTKPAHSSDSS